MRHTPALFFALVGVVAGIALAFAAPDACTPGRAAAVVQWGCAHPLAYRALAVPVGAGLAILALVTLGAGWEMGRGQRA